MPASPATFSDAMILTGPTGSGKSALALEIAPRLNAEIIAMDSMTLYRGMDIGTAKPSTEERARVPHHLLDVLDPWESGSVAWWLDRAAKVCEDVRVRGKRVLFVGGTPFYLKALQFGLFEAPVVDSGIRIRLEEEAERSGKEALHARLASVDARTASRLHPNDVRRVVRALEVFEATGRPISELQSSWNSPAFQADTPLRTMPRTIIIQWPRDILLERIDRRVRTMLESGWVDEVERLWSAERTPSKEASRALGYSELRDYLAGRTTWEETEVLIRTHTRQFAKRQATWFRHLSYALTADAGREDLMGVVLRGFESGLNFQD